MINRYSHLVSEILIASYAYYHLDKTIMTDIEYDEKVRWLTSQPRQRLKNKLDKLINWKTLKTGTSLFYIREREYPQGLKRICLKWLQLLDESNETYDKDE